MKKLLKTSALLTGILLSLTTILRATPIEIPVLADAEIRSGTSADTMGGGAAAAIYVGSIDAARKTRSLLTFDLSSLPTDVTITSVKLVLDARPDSSSPDVLKTVELHQLTQSFDEATVTWNSSSAGNAWSTAGGAFSPTVLASTQVSTRAVSGLDVTWESSALTSFVQTQYASQSVASFILKATDANEALTSRELVFFFASENENTSYSAPRLLIEYTQIPEPSAVGLLLGTGGLATSFALRRLGCRRKHSA
ncbi:Disaggregatase related repeat protein [Opitutaceae bacterium TAV1]|nr:Disaggregatase related repeat protein [Opitutaceae bacterium TAV1]